MRKKDHVVNTQKRSNYVLHEKVLTPLALSLSHTCFRFAPLA